MAHLKYLAAALLSLPGWLSGAMAAEPPIEYAIKASYLYKFAPFVEWPPAAFAGPTAPLTICVAGQDPFGPMLEEAVRGQRVNGHPIAVRHVETVRSGMACHILFVGNEQAEDELRIVAHEPVLTVTDRNHGGSGGMVQFVTVGGRVRFMIDQGLAEDSGITISSKLLGLAVKVTR
jgi:hypothetical protein